MLGFGEGLASGAVRVGAAAGALPTEEAGMACDAAAGSPRGGVWTGVDLVGSGDLGVAALVGRLLKDAEVIAWDGVAATLPSGPIGSFGPAAG